MSMNLQSARARGVAFQRGLALQCGMLAALSLAILGTVWAQDPAVPLVWEERAGLIGVPQTTWTRMTYDSFRRVCLAVSAPSLESFHGLWSWNGATWNPLLAAAQEPHSISEIVFDTARGVAVIYAASAAQVPGSTWEWNGTTLTLASTNGPPGRHGCAMAYDSTRRRTILYGGHFPLQGIEAAYTWEWDGIAWQVAAAPAQSPLRRTGCAAAYDAKRQVIVMFGGALGITNNSPHFRETWTWDGASWSLASTAGPSGRSAHQMIYDSRREKVLLFGGTDGSETGGNLGLNDLWEWDGTQWSQLTPPTAPLPRYDSGFAYDGHRKQVVLLGGLRRASPGGQLIDLNDTWLFGPQSTWVDYAYSGTENGTFERPFNTVSEGVNAALVGGLVRIKSGHGLETLTITKRVTLEAPLGWATIGQ
jgi:hypothetical protein